jgi:hypothetical protein
MGLVCMMCLVSVGCERERGMDQVLEGEEESCVFVCML